MKKNILILGALTLLSQVAVAAPQVRTWINPACETGDCDVKAMRMYVTKGNNGKVAGNTVVGEIETKDKETLRKYAFVQYIKGCNYEENSAGQRKFRIRTFFGKAGVPFQHKTFEIDSATDKDPIYWSNAFAGYDELRGFEVPRHSPYYTGNPETGEKYGSYAGKDKNLTSAKLYIQDAPSYSVLGFANGKLEAANASLDFKLCVYEISKLPKVENDPTMMYPDPINCMEWSSNYIFNFKKKTFEEKKEISSACN